MFEVAVRGDAYPVDLAAGKRARVVEQRLDLLL